MISLPNLNFPGVQPSPCGGKTAPQACATKGIQSSPPTARQHSAVFRFAATEPTSHPFAGTSAINSLAAYRQRVCRVGEIAKHEGGSPAARSQHLVEHFRNASKTSAEIFMDETYSL